LVAEIEAGNQQFGAGEKSRRCLYIWQCFAFGMRLFFIIHRDAIGEGLQMLLSVDFFCLYVL
jgi:hypothetical protein